MSFLDQFLPEQRSLLVSLPYRVGLFVSRSDRAGGDNSDESELQALSDIVTAYAQEVFGSEIVQYIVSETVMRKAEWSAWSKDLDVIEEECFRAVDMLLDITDEKEVNAFRRSLLEIGEAVALAFREYGAATPLWDKVMIYLLYLKSAKEAQRKGFTPMEWDRFINISLAERRALRTVAKALGTTYT